MEVEYQQELTRILLLGGIIAPIADATVISYAGKSSSKSHALGDVDAIGAMVIYPISKNFLLKIKL